MSIRHILSTIREADLDYDLIQENDRICVGISGGKDSMLLLYALCLYRDISLKQNGKKFEVVGIHIDMNFGGMDFSNVISFCKEHNIEFYNVESKLYDILKLNKDKHDRISCSLCSTLKKGAVIKAAKEYNCNKTAFAHHADDAIETLFLNAIYGGKLSTFAPKMYLTNSDMNFIRPFVYTFESDITNTTNELELPLVKSTCPNDGFTKRQEIKDLLNDIYSKYPMAKNNFLKMLHNEDKVSLWVKVKNND